MSEAPTKPLQDSGSAVTTKPPARGMVILFSEHPINGDGLCPEGPELVLGRGIKCQLHVQDNTVSRRHAVVRFHGGGATVEDTGSSHGTFLSGKKVAGEAVIKAGDVLRCGRTLLTVVEDVEAYRGWRRWGLEEPLVGGPAMRAVRREAAKYAGSDLEILLTGETGTGKDVLAKLIHQRSGRRGLFVPVNCASLPETLAEAELFGAMRGAFSGAVTDRSGYFVQADHGTLFLDEVTELPPALQPKLLRAVDTKEVRPLGGQQTQKVDLRIISATNRDPEAEVARKRFREDLFQRLYGARLHLPPLRRRVEDIPLMVEHLLYRLRQEPAASEKPGSSGRLEPRWLAKPPSATFLEQLLLYPWPGNVRELVKVLRDALEEATFERAEQLKPRHLRQKVLEATAPERTLLDHIVCALQRTRGNVTHAISEVGISKTKFYNTMNAHGIDPNDYRE